MQLETFDFDATFTFVFEYSSVGSASGRILEIGRFVEILSMANGGTVLRDVTCVAESQEVQN